MTGYLAPLEGITTHIYRNACHTHFVPMDKYFTPFIVPASKRPLRTREKRDVLPENNAGLPVIPQILTNSADSFLEVCAELSSLGYGEVNLNLGCPSGTVTSRGKGAGFLQFPEELDAFLDTVTSRAGVRISVKMRLGWADPQEFEELLPVVNRYPLTELILHPRVRQEYYRGTPHRDAFRQALSRSAHPLVYNGNLFTPEDIRSLFRECPETAGVMLGRGVICNPGLWTMAKGGTVTKEQFRAFHDDIYSGYQNILSGPDPVIHKMKEIWCYMIQSFTNAPAREKQLRKAHRLPEYERFIHSVFQDEDLCLRGFVPPQGWQVKQ